MSAAILVDGKMRPVHTLFSSVRALVDYDGLFVLIDRAPSGQWELSGDPAENDAEREALAAAIAPMQDKSILTVTPDDDGGG